MSELVSEFVLDGILIIGKSGGGKAKKEGLLRFEF